MNDAKSFSILLKFLSGESLTRTAQDEGISIVRVSQIVKRQTEYLLPEEENIKYFTPRAIRETKREQLLSLIFDHNFLEEQKNKDQAKNGLQKPT